MSNIKVSDFLKSIDYAINNITKEEKLDPSEICMAVILPGSETIERTAECFKEIYAFDVFEPDVGILKMKAKFFTEQNYTLPTLQDFIDMPDQNPNFDDLKSYEICICSEDSDESYTLYHLGNVVRFDYRMIGDYAYLIILLEYSLVEKDTYERENIFKEMGFKS